MLDKLIPLIEKTISFNMAFPKKDSLQGQIDLMSLAMEQLRTSTKASTIEFKLDLKVDKHTPKQQFVFDLNSDRKCIIDRALEVALACLPLPLIATEDAPLRGALIGEEANAWIFYLYFPVLGGQDTMPHDSLCQADEQCRQMFIFWKVITQHCSIPTCCVCAGALVGI